MQARYPTPRNPSTGRGVQATGKIVWRGLPQAGMLRDVDGIAPLFSIYATLTYARRW